MLKAIARLIGLFILLVVVDFAIVYWAYLCLGWAHDSDARVPNLSFWAVFWVMSALGSMVAMASAAASNKD